MATSVEQVTRQAVAPLALRERQLAQTEALAHVGRSTWDARTDEPTRSSELYRIGGLTGGETASQHEFLPHRHPDDLVRVSLARGRAIARLTENALDLVTMLDPDGLIAYVSPAVDRVLGRTPPAPIGHQVLAFVHPDVGMHLLAALEQVVATPGVPVVAECRVRHRDSSWRVLESVGQANVDTAGRLRAVVHARLAAGVGTAVGTRDASPTRR